MSRPRKYKKKQVDAGGDYAWEEPSEILVADDSESEWKLQEQLRIWEIRERQQEDWY
jgi:hypothetical protein